MKGRWALIIFFLLWTVTAQAVLELEVHEPIQVYARPNKSSSVLSQLGRGDRVPISEKSRRGYRKVLITYNGQRRTAYIRASDIRRSLVVERSYYSKGRPLRERYAAGLTVTGSFLRQGERSVTSDADEIYEVSTFQSFTPYFGFFFHMPMGEKYALSLSVNFRETAFSGTAQVEGASEEGEVKLEQSFISAGCLVKIYGSDSSQFWWGLGGELAKGTDVSLSVDDGTPVKTTDDDLPFFVVLTGAVGWDILLWDKFYLIPEARIGSVVNTDPYMLTGEVSVSGAYGF